MPQIQLPVFPQGSSAINPELAFERKDNQVVYLNGHLPVYTHGVEDLASFRLFTTQLIVNGTASNGEIARAFGVPLRTVKRCVKRFRQRGANAFFLAPPKRQGKRLTPECLTEAQGLLDAGQTVPEVSAKLSVLATTLHKALGDGRLRRFKKKS